KAHMRAGRIVLLFEHEAQRIVPKRSAVFAGGSVHRQADLEPLQVGVPQLVEHQRLEEMLVQCIKGGGIWNAEPDMVFRLRLSIALRPLMHQTYVPGRIRRLDKLLVECRQREPLPEPTVPLYLAARAVDKSHVACPEGNAEHAFPG